MQNKIFGVGIDLGTTKHSIGVWMNNRFQIIENEEGFGSTPSYIAFTDKEILIGEAAKNQAARNPLNTIFDINRMIGRTFYDPQIQQDLKFWPFQIEQGPQDKIVIVVKNKGIAKKFYPEDLQALLIKKLKQIAEKFLKQEIKEAVVTVEYSLNILQRQSIHRSMKLAGLQCQRIDFGCVSSATAYLYDQKQIQGAKQILTFSLGGGSLNTLIVSLEQGLVECVSISGNDHLGGQDFDNKLIEYCCVHFIKICGIDLRKNSRAILRLRNQCEKAKRALSAGKQALIEVDGIFENYDFSLLINRGEFEEMCLPLFLQCIQQVKQVIRDGNINEIQEVLFVGGSSRIPKIAQLIQNLFKHQVAFKTINTEYSAVKGASIKAASLKGSQDSQIEEILVMDLLSIAVGIEKEDGEMLVMAPRCQTIVLKSSVMITTTFDNQKAIFIQLYQGYGRYTKDCIKLGQLKLDGLKPDLKGVPKIEVTLKIDENNLIELYAEDRITKIKNKITVDFNQDNMFLNYVDALNQENEDSQENKRFCNYKVK